MSSSEKGGQPLDNERPVRSRGRTEDVDLDIDPEACLNEHPDLGPKLRSLFRRLDETAPGRSVPRALGDFRIVREIGSGGMATVYEAEQVSLNRRVAVKVLSPHLRDTWRSVERFRREARAASRQSHPGVVAIYSVGEESGFHYIAQELVEGGKTLGDELASRRRAEDRGFSHEALRLDIERIVLVAAALQHVHESGVIHRDVKPSNILLDSDGRPKVSDFGLARLEEALELSRTGDFAGTPYYMSPEQVKRRRREIDRRTDVFSLGVTLYEMLTLVRPFDGETSREVFQRIITREPQDPRELEPHVPRDLGVICMKAMEKQPRHRYPTMQAMEDDLRRYLDDHVILARPPGLLRRGTKWSRSHPLGFAVIAACLVALTVVGALFSHKVRLDNVQQLEAASHYRSVDEALGWPDFVYRAEPARWCRQASPRAPIGDLLYAILAVADCDWPAAVSRLASCLDKCEEEREPGLDEDARYLLAVATLGLASQRSDGEQEKLLGEAVDTLRGMDRFDPRSGALIWRALDPDELGEVPLAERIRQGIRLNDQHSVVITYRGLLAFQTLHLGGDIEECETAIGFLEEVVRRRAEDVVALTFLARSYYLLMRISDSVHLIDEAEALLDRALRASRGPPYQLLFVTRGQLDLMRGSEEEARAEFERAIAVAEPGDRNVHSAYRELGGILAREGRFEEGLMQLEDARLIMPGDPHVHLDISEMALFLGDGEKALDNAEIAIQRREGSASRMRSKTRLAAAHLARARSRLALGDERAAFSDLNEMYETSRHDPSAFCRGCFVIISFFDAFEETGLTSVATALAFGLANRVGHGIDAEGDLSATLESAQGAAAFVRGEFEEATARLEKARRIREHASSSNIGRMDDARDAYLAALAQAALCRQGKADGEPAVRAREWLLWAEKRYAERPAFFADADLLHRLREKARAAVRIESSSAGS